MVIRACEPEDIGAVTAIYGDAVRTGTATFELTPPSEAEMRARHADLVGDGYPYLVLQLDGAVAGYAYAGAYRARPAYRSTLESSVYVDGRFRRRGVGAALLAALIHAAAAAGYRQMIAVIGDSANVASIGLHAAAGFEHAGVLRSVGWKHGRWLDTVLMQRPLGAGDTQPSALAPHP
jgi:phosphinothricin acetyltransferase